MWIYSKVTMIPTPIQHLTIYYYNLDYPNKYSKCGYFVISL